MTFAADKVVFVGSTIKSLRKGAIMKKSFCDISAQIERIYTLYLKGYGTKKMLATAEKFFICQKDLGLCF